jgi:hypothetical protein
MKEEIKNLQKCAAGKVIGQAKVVALKKKHTHACYSKQMSFSIQK